MVFLGRSVKQDNPLLKVDRSGAQTFLRQSFLVIELFAGLLGNNYFFALALGTLIFTRLRDLFRLRPFERNASLRGQRLLLRFLHLREGLVELLLLSE